MKLRNKIKGMIIAGCGGDALGMPVETKSMAEILELHPNGIMGYLDPSGHKWFDGLKAGDTTDDKQLTVATMKGLMIGNGFNMETIAAAHIEAYKETTMGWGKTSREAVRALANGVPWQQSGRNAGTGTGNGVVMKIAPLAALWTTAKNSQDLRFNQFVVDFTAMTHATTMAAIASLIHVWMLYDLLYVDPKNFNEFNELDIPLFVKEEGQENSPCEPWLRYTLNGLEVTEDDIYKPLEVLRQQAGRFAEWTSQDIVDRFGGGTSYVYHSLPFSYAFFFKQPHDFQTISDVIEAGGDTDTNAKLVAEMIGALHGIEFFQTEKNKWFLDGLNCYEELDILCDQFCDQFGIP